MNTKSQSAIVRRHLRGALVLGWTGYLSGLMASATLGLAVYALATGHRSAGIAGLLVTAALGMTILGALWFCLSEANDRRDQLYLRHALRSHYIRSHPRKRPEEDLDVEQHERCGFVSEK
jgi:heme/copper-type cytochrome/quinol oxidase subunit 3